MGGDGGLADQEWMGLCAWSPRDCQPCDVLVGVGVVVGSRRMVAVEPFTPGTQ